MTYMAPLSINTGPPSGPVENAFRLWFAFHIAAAGGASRLPTWPAVSLTAVLDTVQQPENRGTVGPGGLGERQA